MNTPQYLDKHGVGFNVQRNSDGTWSVWCLHNKQPGWIWVATLKSYDLAMSFMGWYSSFEETGEAA